jgi:hypothetical protein
MPGNVRGIHVMGLVDDIDELGEGTHVNKLAEKINADLTVLLPILSAAELLGVVRSENGSLFLTEDGLKLKDATIGEGVLFMGGKLASIEPFKTALELASQRGETTAKDVAGSLLKRGIEWDYRSELNESMVDSLLVHWAIRGGLLTYDGKSGKFRAVRTAS